jgi:1,4-dihydroxy-2-naphthoyl-CoA hydrolase
MYVWRTTVKLHDTDSAGLLFFAHQFKIAHDCYEAMLASIGFSLSWVIRESDFLLPIVHAESDFIKPLGVDDPLELHLRVEKLGVSSYTLFHDIQNAGGETVGTVRTVHVVVDKKTGRKTAIPEKFRAALAAL